MLLNNQQIKEEIKRTIKKYLKTNEIGNVKQNLWAATKRVLRGKFIAIMPASRNKKSLKKPSVQFKEVEKKTQCWKTEGNKD